MSVSEKLGSVPVEGLTWGKLAAGLAGFTTVLVGAATLFTILVVPVVVAQADTNARSIVREEAVDQRRALDDHAHFAEEQYRDSVKRREFDDHKTYATEQFALIRADLRAVLEEVKNR